MINCMIQASRAAGLSRRRRWCINSFMTPCWVQASCTATSSPRTSSSSVRRGSLRSSCEEEGRRCEQRRCEQERDSAIKLIDFGAAATLEGEVACAALHSCSCEQAPP